MIRITLPTFIIYEKLPRRASVSSSLNMKKQSNKKASVTVEAALAVPLFFLAVVSLLYLFEIASIQTAVRAGLQNAAKVAASEAYPLAVITPGSVQADVVNAIGADRLQRSIVVGGSSGIRCEGSYLSPVTGMGEVKASFDVRIPIPMFGIPPITYEISLPVKAWIGFEKSAFGNGREEVVYVTETGLVYHKDYHCTYLDLSIHATSAGEIEGLRNEDGGKYSACAICGGGSGLVYITNTGESYHSSLTCSGLKRTIYAVPLSEVVGKGACSRCGK